jgi:hypothetical protein
MPAPVNVTALPDKVAGPETMLKLTSKLELAVALREKGTSPKVRLFNTPKEIV